MKSLIRRAIIPVVLLLLASPLGAEVRTWRDQVSDVAVDAELIKVEGEKITLKMANGKSFTYPVTRFHEDDQAYAKEWADEHGDEMVGEDKGGGGKATATAPAEVRRALQVVVKEESEAGASEKTGTKDSKGKKRTENTHFTINLINARSGPAMKDLEVAYTVYKRTRTSDTKNKDGNRTIFEKEADSEKVASLLPGTSTTLKTKSIPTTDSTTPYKAGKKTYEKRLSEEVVGIVVKVTSGGAEVTTIEQPPGLLRTVEKGE
jgi:hypothetical protein